MSGAIGIIAGSDLASEPRFSAGNEHLIVTDHGATPVHVLDDGSACLIQRHGPRGCLPPHAVPYLAHVSAFEQLAVRGIVSLCSVGSLRSSIRPGAVVVVDDWIEGVPLLSFFDREARHATPSLDEDLRAALLQAARSADLPVVDGGTYWQTRGPRLETRAEVRMLAQFADVVGMTFGSEATLANELGIPVAALCTVDNMAHGLEPEQALIGSDILERRADRAVRLAALLDRLITLVDNR